MSNMLRSKQEVDKYVSSILCSLRDERERLNKYYQIARLYAEIKEYDPAKKYLEGYISHRNDFAPAYKLMGQIMEGQACIEKAVTAYKRSLELDDKQKNVLVKICELYCLLDVDPERAKYWADCVEKSCPNHEVAFKLREKALASRRGDGGAEGREELELLLSSELVRNPKDVGVRVKLLQLYMNSGRVNEAYEHALGVEKTVAFTQSLAWYQCFLDLLLVYKREHEHTVNGVYHQMLIHVLNSLTTLTLEQKPVTEAMDVLFRLDQTLYDVDNQAIQGDQWTVLLREMQAQLFYHVGTYLLKKAKQGKMSWKEATDYAAACYLCSATYKPPLRHSPWYAMATDEDRKLLDYWWQAAHYRCSQIGHMINQLSGFGGNTWMARIDGEFCTDQGKQKIFSQVFTLPNMRDKKTSSYLIKNTSFTIIAHEMPRDDQLRDYDNVTYALRADNLHSLVWTALQYHTTKNKTQPDYQMRIFDSLQYGVLNLDSGILETLSQLDTEAFLLATVYVSAHKLADLHTSLILEPGQPSVLPAALMSSLVTPEQNEWWEMARKVATGTAKDQFSKMRLTLQRGLEVIRMVGNHGMTIDLVTHLARTFEERVQVAKTNMNDVLDLANDIASLEERSKKYWKVVVDMAEKHMRGVSPSVSKQPLFGSPAPPLSEEQYLAVLQEARYHTALYTMESGKKEEAIELLEKVHTPEASFYQAKLYSLLASGLSAGELLEQTEGEDRFKLIGLLTKARDRFYTTLDRLRGDRFHKLNADLANEIEDVECKLNLLEADNPVPRADTSLNGTEVDESVIPHASTMAQMRGLRGGDQSHSILASTPRRALDMSKAAHTPGRSFAKPTVVSQLSSAVDHVTSSTPPRLRPSPERLEAQMRQFTHTQDTVVMSLLEELKDRRKEMQELQEKCVVLEREKNDMMKRVFESEKEKERAVIRTERIADQQQEVEEQKRRIQRREDELQTDKQKVFDERKDIQLEKDRHAGESKRLEEDWRRVTVDRERVDRERGEVEDRRRGLEKERDTFDEEKKKLQSEKTKFENEKTKFESEKAKIENEKVKFELEKTKFENEKKKFEEEKANQPAQPAGTSAADLFNLRQQHPFQQAPYDYLQSAGFMHGRFPGFPPQGQGFTGPAAAPGFPGSLPQGFGYPGTGIAAHGPTRMGASEAHQAAAALQDADDIYYEDDEDESENNGLVSGHRSLGSQLASGYMYPHSIPSIFSTTSQNTASMPGPGFFASPDRSQVSSSQVGQFGLGVVSTGSPQTALTTQLTGRPSLGQTNTSLANLLTSPAIVSQVQGAALFSALAGSNSSPNTKFPMSMPIVTTAIASAVVSKPVAAAADTTTVVSQPQFGSIGTKPKDEKESQDKSKTEKAVDAENKEEDDQNESYNDPSHEPQFEALVNLSKVETKTGEEGEKVLYECRAKLYRFIESQWKDRGVGQIKILQKDGDKKVRVVMRREHVLKVCANHVIKADMEIKERDDMKGNVLTWRALDFSDDEPRVEQFCLKMKTPEICQEFKLNFEKGIKLVKESELVESKKSATVKDKSEAKGETRAPTAKVDLAEKFKPEEGTWLCPGCCLMHKPEVLVCPACEAFQPGKEAEAAEEKKKKSQLQFGAGNFKFGSSSGAGSGSTGGFSFGANPSSTAIGGLGSRTDSASSFSSMQSGGSFGFGPSATATSADVNGNASAGGSSLVTSLPKPSASGFGGFKMPTSTSDDTKPAPPLFGGFKVPTTASTGVTTETVSSTTTTTAAATNSSTTHTMGGFTFTKKPEVQESKKEEKKKDEKQSLEVDQKASPFAGFSFGGKGTMGETKGDGAAKTSIFGGSVTANEAPSFASLTKASDGVQAFTQKADSKGFQGAGTPLFGGVKTQKTPTKGGTSETEGAEGEYEPDVDFKPLVQLEKIETKTGEEDEETLFDERSKLYRFDRSTKQWKERGIGQMRILQHRGTLKFRVVMRREQVLKMCANHILTKEMTISSFEGSDKMYRWMANDFAEEELKQEMLAAKFKTVELALNFKNVFEESVEKLKKGPEETKQPDPSSSKQPQQPLSSAEVSSTSTKDSLADKFKMKEGEWECEACLIRNKPDLKRCAACQTVRTGCEAEVAKATSGGRFGFSSSSSSGQTPLFGGQASSTTGAPQFRGFAFGGGAKPDSSVINPGLQSGGGFLFGGAKPKDTTANTTPEKQGPLSGGFKFGTAAASPGTSPFAFTKSPEKDKVTSSSDVPSSMTTSVKDKDEKAPPSSRFGVNNFSFSGLTPLKDSTKPKSPVKSPGGDGEYYRDEDEGENIYFEPIVSLPDDYEYQTGEENEVILYTRKAKLYRFTDGQWKERGVGEVKLLREKTSPAKTRILMRRDQVHKVCLNHCLLPDMELKPMADSKGKAFVWHANDFSEGEFVHEQFAIRFKTDIIASDFKECFDNAKQGKPVKMMTLEEVSSPRKQSEGDKNAVSATSKDKNQDQKDSQAEQKPQKTFADAFDFKLPATSDESKVTSTTTTAATTATPSKEEQKSSGFGGGFTFGQKTFNFGDTPKNTEPNASQPSSSSTSLFGSGQGFTPGTQTFKFGSSSSLSTSKTTTPLTSGAGVTGGDAASTKSAQKSLLADLLASGDTSASDSAFNPSQTNQQQQSASDQDDVIFISEKLPTPQQEARAKQFMLPKTFYFYEDSDFPTCKGCIGCDPDNFDMEAMEQQPAKDDDVIFLYEETSSPSKQSLLNKYQLPPNFYSYEHTDGCTGCPGCEASQNEPESAVIQAALSFLGGDAANAYESSRNAQSTTLSPDEEIIHAAQAFVTGNRGNLDYAKELKPQIQQPGGEIIQSSQTFITGDRGNVDYAKKLGANQKTEEEVIQQSQAFVTGDRGNVAYAQQLGSQKQQPVSEVITSSQASITGDKGNTSYLKSLLAATEGKELSQQKTPTKQEADSTTEGSTVQPVFGTVGSTGGFDFASLAGKTEGFGFAKKQEGKPFQWQGAGQSLFSLSPRKPGGVAEGDDEAGQEDVEREPEVHFEPVVQLSEVEVTTGEEGEEVLYNQRSKLYRYDNGQWKERGLGEMKILRHKETGKYRLLQRREQVLKICCNQAITLDTTLSKMQTSETTWCWFGMDNSESDPKVEQFALRFKNAELASAFYDKIESCKEDLRRQEDQPAAQVAESTSEKDGAGGDASTQGNEYEDYGDSDDEQNVLFNKRATMFYVNDDNSATSVGMGDFSLRLDEDIMGYRVNMKTDEGQDACNHVICRRYVVQKNDKRRFAEWTAKDFSTDEPVRRTFRVVFSSASAVKEFTDCFNQGVTMARESEIDEVADSTSITGELILSSAK